MKTFKTFREFVEAKKHHDKIRLASNLEGEPIVVGGDKPKKKVKFTFDDSGEPTVVRNAKK
jgi:hypothetical protein